MASVYVTSNADPEDEKLEPLRSFAEVPWLGEYFFLYPGVQKLSEATHQTVHAAKRAFFAGNDLQELEAFVAEWKAVTLTQPEVWQQRCGRKATGEVWYESTFRLKVLEFLGGLAAAVATARAQGAGVYFSGC